MENHNKPYGRGYEGDVARNYDNSRFESHGGYYINKIEFRMLKEILKKLDKNSKILELGCGTGRFSIYCANAGFDTTGADISEDMLSIALSKADINSMIKFRVEDCTKVKIEDEMYDFVFAIRLLNQLGKKIHSIEVIKEMTRIAKKEGYILVEFVNSGRPLKIKSKSISLSFSEVKRELLENNCLILSKQSIFIIPMTIFNWAPSWILPLIYRMEVVLQKVFLYGGSRGYILAKKNI